MPLITESADDQTLLKRTRSRRESTRSKRDSALVLKKHPRISWSKTAHHLTTDDDQRSAQVYEDKPLPSLPSSNPSFQLAHFLRNTGPPKEKPSPKQSQTPKFSVQNSRYFPFRSRARRQGTSERVQNSPQPPANLSSATIQRRVTRKGSKYLEIALNVDQSSAFAGLEQYGIRPESPNCARKPRNHQKRNGTNCTAIEAFYHEPESTRVGFDDGHRQLMRQSSWSSIDDLAPDFFSDPWIVQLGSQDSQESVGPEDLYEMDPMTPGTRAKLQVAPLSTKKHDVPRATSERKNLRGDSTTSPETVALAMRHSKGTAAPLSRNPLDDPKALRKASQAPTIPIPERSPRRPSSRISDQRRTLQLQEQDRLGSRILMDHPAQHPHQQQHRRSTLPASVLSQQLSSDQVSQKPGSVRSSISSYTLRPPSGAPIVYNVSEKRLSGRRSSLNQFGQVQHAPQLPRRESAQSVTSVTSVEQSAEERLKFLERKNRLLEAALSAMLNTGAQVDEAGLMAGEGPLEVFMRQNSRAVAQHAQVQLGRL